MRAGGVIQGESEVWYESEAEERAPDSARDSYRQQPPPAYHGKVEVDTADARAPTESGDTNQEFERYETAI